MAVDEKYFGIDGETVLASPKTRSVMAIENEMTTKLPPLANIVPQSPVRVKFATNAACYEV